MHIKAFTAHHAIHQEKSLKCGQCSHGKYDIVEDNDDGANTLVY